MRKYRGQREGNESEYIMVKRWSLKLTVNTKIFKWFPKTKVLKSVLKGQKKIDKIKKCDQIHLCSKQRETK